MFAWGCRQNEGLAEPRAEVKDLLCAIPEFAVELALSYGRAFSKEEKKYVEGECLCGLTLQADTVKDLHKEKCSCGRQGEFRLGSVEVMGYVHIGEM